MIQNPREFPTSGHNPQSLTVAAPKIKRARMTQAKKKYLRWLNKNYPDVLKRALDRADLSRSDIGLSGLGQNNGEDQAWYDKILNTLPDVVKTYTAYEQQEKLIEINAERAKRGLPPLEKPPAVSAQVEAGPETRKTIQESVTNLGKMYLPWIAGGIGLFLLMRK